MVTHSSQLYFSGNARFDDDRAVYGGAIYFISSTVTFLDGANVTFAKNLAGYDGTFYLTSASYLHFPGTSFAAVIFEQNHAEAQGSVVFVQDCNALSYCEAEVHVTDYFGPVQDFSFLFDDIANEASLPDKLYFYNNRAEEARNAIMVDLLASVYPMMKIILQQTSYFEEVKITKFLILRRV